MECKEVVERWVGSLDGGLAPRVQQDIGEHLEWCYLCAEELKVLSSVEETCRAALRFPGPHNRFEALRPHLRTPHVLLPPPRYGVR